MAPTVPKYIQKLLNSNQKVLESDQELSESHQRLLTKFAKIEREIRDLKEKVATDGMSHITTSQSTNSSSWMSYYNDDSSKYSMLSRRNKSSKAVIITLLNELFPSEEEDRDLIDEKYRQMTCMVLKACKAIIRCKQNEGVPWKDVSPQDKLSLIKQAADRIAAANTEMKFVYDCEHLWLVAFLVQICWTNRATKYNEKIAKRAM